MGFGLSHPVSSKQLTRVGNANFRVGMATMHGLAQLFCFLLSEGWRDTMEDAHTIVLNLPKHEGTAFFGIYDGHSGSLCSNYMADRLYKDVDDLGDIFDEKALAQVVMACDQSFLDS